MKVLHIITSLNDGGAQAVLYHMIKNDVIDEHTVICLCGDGKYSQALAVEGIEVVHLEMPRGGIRFAGLKVLLQQIRKSSPDVVQTWMYHSDLIGGVVARMAGVKNIVWGIHNSTLDKRGTALSTRLVVVFLRWTSWFLPAAIISCSQKALELHIKIGYNAKKMRFVANGYDLSLFKPTQGSLDSLSHKPVVPAGTFIFTTVARWDPQKDHRNLIDAVTLLVKRTKYRFACLLVGPNVDKNNIQLKQMISERGLENIIFLCGTSSRIVEIMNSSDCHVLPSAYGEAFPNVVAEALACSLPCIVTDVGDAADMVGQDGWVVDPKKPADLARAMEDAMSLFQSDAEWSLLKSKCRQRAESNLGVHKMIESYRNIWREN